jgi:uncharacterized protein (TIGR03066 family)
MRTITGSTLAIVLLAVAGVAGAQPKDEKIDGKKLIGKWEPADGPKEFKVVIEFSEKGKVTVSADIGGKAETIEGTYKLSGDKLTVSMKKGDKEKSETMTITKLTDTELVATDEKGKEEKLKRVVEKKAKEKKKKK